jgi:radical SAM protein with 4Fe4S-binding SPASM domain
MGCQTVVLSHYNEPLEDPRLASIALMAKSYGFQRVWAATNMDLMTPERAAELDGKFDQLFVALYPTADFPYKRLGSLLAGPEDAQERAAWLRSLFHRTHLDVRPPEADGGMHIPSHFSPIHPIEELAEKYSTYPCHEPVNRMIVNHRGDMLMCCQDVVGHFELGSVHNQSVKELWYSERHQAYVRALSKPGGRFVHDHCVTCPQLVAGGEKY